MVDVLLLKTRKILEERKNKVEKSITDPFLETYILSTGRYFRLGKQPSSKSLRHKGIDILPPLF